MNICSDDYIVIDKYANGDPAWINQVDTVEKRIDLIEFSRKVAEIFISVGAHTGDWQRYYKDHL